MELPNEVKMQILLNLTYKDILAFCTSNTSNKSLCHDRFFWSMKTERDFNVTSDKFYDENLNPRILYEFYSLYTPDLLEYLYLIKYNKSSLWGNILELSKFVVFHDRFTLLYDLDLDYYSPRKSYSLEYIIIVYDNINKGDSIILHDPSIMINTNALIMGDKLYTTGERTIDIDEFTNEELNQLRAGKILIDGNYSLFMLTKNQIYSLADQYF